jgi:uncharacterized membrane protein/predicted amidophosphoribosyltransferase
MAEKKCTSCQADMDADAIFCNECGSVQAVKVIAPDSPENLASAVRTTERTCPRCNGRIEGEIKFCPGCAFDFAATEVLKVGGLICPKCQKPYNPDDRFCRSCAFDLSSISRVSSAQFCTGCGKPFELTDRFCRHCSTDISKSDHTVAVPVVNQATFSQPNISIPANLSTSFVAPQSQMGTAPSESVGDSPKGPHWISPSAAAFVVICFFLPWVEWSCFGSSVPVSGAQLSNRDASFLVFPLAAIVTIAVYFIFKSQRRLWKARPYILVSSAFGLLFLFYKVSSIPSASVFGTTISASDLGFKPQVGGFGTIIGFIIAMIGCAFMGKSVVVLPGSTVTSGWLERPSSTSAASSTSFFEKIALLKPNKAAMLCYLTPILGPILIQIISIPLVLLFSGVPAFALFISLLFFLAILLTPFITQVMFLKREPHKRNPFVRFHAFQSLFQIGICWAAILILFGGIYVASNQPTFGGPSSFAQLLIFLIYGIGIGNWVLGIFMAVKANRNELYKLPYIGDWALGYSKQDNSVSNLSIR